jgi:hypothetical protein
MIVAGADFAAFSKSLTAAVQALPAELGNRLHNIRCSCFAKYGFEGAYKRLNNRSVTQILAEFQDVESKPIVSGELDGIRYELHDRPSQEP